MIVSIHQPNFLPWLGFFDKVDRSDVFILLDNVQFEKNDWQNRNRIKGANGPQWLTVPVQHKFPQTIAETRINDTVDWRRKHWNAITANYGKAPEFQRYGPIFEEVYRQTWTGLADLNIHLLRIVFDLLGLRQPVRLASELPVHTASSQRLAELCRAAGADVYLAGAGGHNYLDTRPFEERQVRVEFQAYQHPVYPQLFGAFEPYLSVMDLLFNCGDRSPDIIRGQEQAEGTS